MKDFGIAAPPGGAARRRSGTGLRSHLRSETADLHATLDRRISGLDLSRRADLGGFLALHLEAFGALAAQDPADVGPVCAALVADLDALGWKRPAAPVPQGPRHPLARRYLLLGSRMGAEVLQRNRARATDPAVIAAGSYFALARERAAWPQLCAALDAIDPAGHDATTIIADARAIFRLFLVAWDRAFPGTSSGASAGA